MTKEQAKQAFLCCMDWTPEAGCRECPLYEKDMRRLSKACLAVGMATLQLEEMIEVKQNEG